GPWKRVRRQKPVLPTRARRSRTRRPRCGSGSRAAERDPGPYLGKGRLMNYDILKRLGLDHLDVGSTDFLDALNKMQKREPESIGKKEPVNDPEFGVIDFVFLWDSERPPQP